MCHSLYISQHRPAMYLGPPRIQGLSDNGPRICPPGLYCMAGTSSVIPDPTSNLEPMESMEKRMLLGCRPTWKSMEKWHEPKWGPNHHIEEMNNKNQVLSPKKMGSYPTFFF